MRSWAVYILAALGFAGYSAYQQADRDGSGAIVAQGAVDAFAMRVGDCFNDEASVPTDGDYEVSSVPGVPCSEPHDNEVFAIFDVDIAEFPEGDGMSALAFDSCLERFEGFVGRDYQTSALDIVTLYPSQESWTRQGDREVVCAVYDLNAAKLTGSARDSGL